MTERPNQSNHRNRSPAVEAVHSQLSGENLSNVSFRASDLHGTGTQRDVLEALLGLANESKPSIRIVAVAEIDRLLNQAPLSPTTQASVVRLIPNLTRSIQLSSDQGVMSDLIRIAGDMGKIAESDISVCKSSEPEKQRTAAIQRLAGAIVAKLYEPGSKISPIILDRSIVALGKFPETSAPLTHPLLEEVLKSQNLPQSVASARDSLKAVALQALTKEESAPKGRSTIAAWLNLHGLIGKTRWSIAESEAVATLTSAFHTPPSFPAPIDSMETARISGHESRLRDAVAALNRFGVRSKGEMPFGASLQGAIALSSCLDSPLHDISALEALGRFGAHAEAAIPAILQVASSKRSSLETRGTALATLGEIFAKLPITELTAGDTLEGRFLDIATNALHGSNPHLIQRTLQSAITLGSKAAPLASAIDFALRENLQSTPLPGEAEEGALEPIALIAIEALAAIDPSGNIATASFDRIFRSPHTPDDIRLQLLLSVEELSEREEISIAIADAITARMIASPETPRYLLDEAFAMTERLEGSFGLHPADLPLSTTALLRSAQLDLNSKTEKLTLLVERAERHPNTVLTILMQAYKDISPYPRLDDIALATLRRLQKLSSR